MRNLQQAPRDRIYRAYWQDGSLDLFAGLTVLGVGIMWLADRVALSAPLPAIMVPLWVVFRNHVIKPRLGEARFDAARRAAVERGQRGLLLLGVAALLAAVAVYWTLDPFPGREDDWTARLAPALPATLVGIAGLGAALFSRIDRLAIYGVAAILLGVVGAIVGLEPGWAIVGSGVFALVSGSVLLARFLQEFPPLPQAME